MRRRFNTLSRLPVPAHAGDATGQHAHSTYMTSFAKNEILFLYSFPYKKIKSSKKTFLSYLDYCDLKFTFIKIPSTGRSFRIFCAISSLQERTPAHPPASRAAPKDLPVTPKRTLPRSLVQRKIWSQLVTSDWLFSL